MCVCVWGGGDVCGGVCMCVCVGGGGYVYVCDVHGLGGRVGFKC